MTHRATLDKETIQRLIDAGIVRGPTKQEWEEALAPLVAQVLAEQESHVAEALMKAILDTRP